MAYADTSTYYNSGDGSIIGSFIEKDEGNLFEFSANPLESGVTDEWPHLVWVNSRNPETRYALVKKTVAYIVVDQDADGNDQVEKWALKQHREYR
jgi:hypothetical protein